jgi:hydroxypyruvate isomerase
MKFAANLSLLWPELPYLERFSAAAAAGFDAVEVLFPYDLAAKETQRALIANGQRMVLMNAPPPNYAGGQRGFAADPDLVDRFQYDMRRVLRYAEALKVPMLHVMTGDGGGDAARETLIRNMAWAAEQVPEGMTLTLEPLSPATMPDYFLNDYALAAEVLAQVDAPNVGLQYDSFHAQVIHGDALAVFDAYQPLIRHIQIGDAPDRTAPGRGTVDFNGLFDRIAASGYDGWISAEYHPNGPTEGTLDWIVR